MDGCCSCSDCKKTPVLRQRPLLPYVPLRFISSESVSDKELQPAGGGTFPKG